MIEYDEALQIFEKSRHHGFASAVLVDGQPMSAKLVRSASEPRHQSIETAGAL
jgi:hypothetical protein